MCLLNTVHDHYFCDVLILTEWRSGMRSILRRGLLVRTYVRRDIIAMPVVYAVP